MRKSVMNSIYSKEHNYFIFSVEKDLRLNSKERVLALISEKKAKVYRFSNFDSNNIIADVFEGNDFSISSINTNNR